MADTLSREKMLALAARFERAHVYAETPEERHLLVAALRLAAKPADEGVREATIEKCAKIADESASVVADGDGEIYIAKKIAALIRKLSTTGEPKL